MTSSWGLPGSSSTSTIMSSAPFDPESGSQSSSLASNMRASMIPWRTFSGLIPNIVPSCCLVDRDALRPQLRLAQDFDLPAPRKPDGADALELTQRAADRFECESQV